MILCDCLPVSIKSTVKKGSTTLTCRHCGKTLVIITKKNGSFLEDKPKYKKPWQKGKHGNPNKRKRL